MSRVCVTVRVWTCAIAAGLDTREEVASIVRALESGAKPLSYVRAVFSRCSVPEDATGQLFAGLTGECRMATEFAHGCTVRLCTLPLRFDTLYSDSVRRKCCVCSTVPESAAICLLCGAFLCAGSSKCKKAMGTGLGPCTTHAKQCGGGVGMFLLVHSSGVRVWRMVVVDASRDGGGSHRVWVGCVAAGYLARHVGCVLRLAIRGPPRRARPWVPPWAAVDTQ